MKRHVAIIDRWHPARLNQFRSRHWSVGHKLRKAETEILKYELVLRRSVPAATGKRRVELTIVLGPRQKGCDPDAYWKLLLDSLVQLQLLRGDSKEWVELAPVRYERGETKATRIVLEDIP